MARNRAVVRFENILVGLQGGISAFGRGVSDSLLAGYSYFYRELDNVRKPLEALGCYEMVKSAVTDAEALVKAGRFDEAEDLILNANRALMKASGTYDALRRAFRAANDDTKSDSPG